MSVSWVKWGHWRVAAGVQATHTQIRIICMQECELLVHIIFAIWVAKQCVSFFTVMSNFTARVHGLLLFNPKPKAPTRKIKGAPLKSHSLLVSAWFWDWTSRNEHCVSSLGALPLCFSPRTLSALSFILYSHDDNATCAKRRLDAAALKKAEATLRGSIR